ncbi:MAG: hypothetical protein KTR15_02020 [Phycisphaeraceae bacterium]|nr:hypothetical protein [Phycisphaeraceae bacterium]
MKRWLLSLAILIALPVLGFGIYLVAYFTVDPSFDATATELANGDYEIQIDPNFVVHSVYRIEVSNSSGVLAVRDEPTQGMQSIVIPGPLPSNHMVTIKSDLVYDRPMPSMTTHTETIRLR